MQLRSEWLAAAIFSATYLLIAVESNLGLHLDRTAAAFCGAVTMVLVRVLDSQQALAAVDWGTLAFLLGMMILVAHFQVSGFFAWAAGWLARLARTRFQLLALLVFGAGVLSAFFVNDTICLVFTPIVLALCDELALPPTPYLIALALASNIGSTASVTGNPQNALVGVSAGFSFLDFLGHLGPVALAGLGVELGVLALLYGDQVRGVLPRRPASLQTPVDRVLLLKCSVSAVVVVVLWMFGYPFPLVALAVAALIFVLGRVPAERIHQRVDWELLLFFASLFVVVRGLEQSGLLTEMVGQTAAWLKHGPLAQLVATSAVLLVLSNLVSNVPAVLLLRPLVPHLPHAHFLWLVVACSSTLAGNLTPFGSVASLIVLQQARRKQAIGFADFTRAGVPVTLLTTLVAVALLAVEYALGWS